VPTFMVGNVVPTFMVGKGKHCLPRYTTQPAFRMIGSEPEQGPVE
jgi:hypothetical protein